MTGHVLEEARKRRGVSQLEAAKLLALSQPMLSHMETGRRNVSADVARRAVELFGAEPTVLPLSVKERHTEGGGGDPLAAPSARPCQTAGRTCP